MIDGWYWLISKDDNSMEVGRFQFGVWTLNGDDEAHREGYINEYYVIGKRIVYND